jgi:hypothetical protein
VLTSARKYFWYDELFSWTLVTDPSLAHMLRALRHAAGGAPPFYHLTMRIWTALFGHSELAFRSASCAGFMLALAVTWATLRRAFGRWPAAVATLFVFGLSPLVLRQVAEARFYALFTALVAIAVYLYTRAIATKSIGIRLAGAICVTHIALLYTHPYGLIYSGAILVAWVVSDRLNSRCWHAGYVAVLLAWMSFVPWIPTLRAESNVGRPHSWIPVPPGGDLLAAYSFSLHATTPFLALVILYGAFSPSRITIGIKPSNDELHNVPSWRLRRLGVTALLVLYGWLFIRRPIVHFVDSSWIAPTLRQPGFHALLLLIVIATVLLRRIRSRLPGNATASGQLRNESLQIDGLIIVGLCLLGVPIVAFLASHLGPSIFASQYFIPASLGVAPSIAYVVLWTSGRSEREIWADDLPARRQPIRSLGWLALLGFAAAIPAVVYRVAPRRGRPGSEVEAVAPPHSIVVVDNAEHLLPILHYQRRSDITYVFPMDSATAYSADELGAATDYNLAAIWEHEGYLSGSTLSGAKIPCTKAEFMVLTSRRLAWFDVRIRFDSAFIVSRIGSELPASEGDMYLVRRRENWPVSCAESPIHAREN